MTNKKPKQLTTAVRLAILATTLGWTAQATASDITISPLISSGSKESVYGEAEPNLWFMLSNNQSMEKVDGTRSEVTPYNPNTIYTMPKDLNGNDMVLHKNHKQGYHFNRPFVSLVTNSSGALDTVNEGDYNSDLNDEPSNDCSNATYPKPDSSNPSKYENNCYIWQNYYRNRMLSLKSTLSLMLEEEENKKKFKKVRVGYSVLDTNTEGDIEALKSKVLPVKALYGTDGDKNLKAFKKWVFAITPAADTQKLREVTANMLGDITKQSRQQNKNNPFLVNPGQDYNDKTNPILACRRNHLLILADGEWSGDSEANASYPQATVLSTEKSHSLPDGKSYTPKPPYSRVKEQDGYISQLLTLYPNDTDLSLSDVTFAAWKTDLDNKSDTNTLGVRNTTVDGTVKTLHGSEYWHPYNDPASWQHVNVHTIGYGIPYPEAKDLTKLKEAFPAIFPSVDTALKSKYPHINPPESGVTSSNDPGINPVFLSDKWEWPVTPDSNQLSSEQISYDLAQAALVSRGRFYNVKKQEDLRNALEGILNLAITSGEIPGVKGAGGTSGSTQTDGTSYYSTRYSSDAFTGELIRNNFYTGKDAGSCFEHAPAVLKYGMLCTKPKWNAARLLTAKYGSGSNYENRKVFSVAKDSSGTTVSYNAIDFKKDSLTNEQKTRLLSNAPASFKSFANDDEKITKLIAYVKGDATEEGTGNTKGRFKKRDHEYKPGEVIRNILGAIMRSSPTFSGMPRISSLHPLRQDASYVDFKKRYAYNYKGESLCTGSCSNPVAKDDVNMVYVGANDGMLHAFRATDGEEVFAYVPDAVYRKLAKVTEEKQQISLVDGNIDVQTINVGTGGKTWKKVLVASMGGGAKGLFALDVTNPTTADKSKIVKWEYSDVESKRYQKANFTQYANTDLDKIPSNAGNIMAKPGTVQLKDGTWVVAVGNGYNASSKKAALILINADTGKVVQELVLDNDYTDDSKTNGLGPVFFMPFSGKSPDDANYIDRAYAGDLQGNLWVFDFTNATKDGGVKVAGATAQKPKPLFVAKYTEGSGSTSKVIKQPITVAPLVRKHPTKYGYIVHFGTGALFEENDLSSTIKNSIYAIWDDWVPGGIRTGGGLPNPRTAVVEKSHLREVVFANLEGQQVLDGKGNKATARVLKRSSGYNAPIAWAISGSDFTTKKRGWYVDLLVGERAWQPAYYTLGAHNVTAIGYNTVHYQKETSGGAAKSCYTKGSGVKSWKMAFNINDATKPLPYFGTLDISKTGNVGLSDLIKANVATGGQVDGTTPTGNDVKDNTTASASLSEYVAFNPNSSSIFKEGAEDCNQVTQVDEDNQGNFATKLICRRSHTGSWSQVK